MDNNIKFYFHIAAYIVVWYGYICFLLRMSSAGRMQTMEDILAKVSRTFPQEMTQRMISMHDMKWNQVSGWSDDWVSFLSDAKFEMDDIALLTRDDIDQEFRGFRFGLRKSLWLFIEDLQKDINRSDPPLNNMLNHQSDIPVNNMPSQSDHSFDSMVNQIDQAIDDVVNRSDQAVNATVQLGEQAINTVSMYKHSRCYWCKLLLCLQYKQMPLNTHSALCSVMPTICHKFLS